MATQSRKSSAITLLELLIVLVILSLLLGIGIPIYQGSINDGRRAAVRENLRTLRLAIDRFQAKNLKSPKKLLDLHSVGISSIPLDPLSGLSDYQLRVASSTANAIWKRETDPLISTWGYDNIRSIATDSHDL